MLLYSSVAAPVLSAGLCLPQESRGAHAREDFSKRDDENWMKHTVAYFDHTKSGRDKVSIEYRAVHDQPLPDGEMKHIPPFARTY